MVAFKNRYMVMEVLFDRNRDLDKDVEDPVLVMKYVNKLTKVCIVRAVREEYLKVWCSITLVKSIARSFRACINAALKCEETKFEHYTLLAGARFTPQNNLDMQKCLETIQTLES